MFGLKLPSDTRMSSQVMGKFYSGLFVTMLTKSRILGTAILSYVFISNSTQEVYRLEQLSLLPVTVLTRKFASFLAYI